MGDSGASSEIELVGSKKDQLKGIRSAAGPPLPGLGNRVSTRLYAAKKSAPTRSFTFVEWFGRMLRPASQCCCCRASKSQVWCTILRWFRLVLR